jgi:DNA-binding XRE family transcriptional regulator
VRAPKLTAEEQTHTLAALRFLHERVGNWRTLAKALGFEKTTMFNVKKGVNEVSINMAYRVSRLAGVAFDDVVTGRYPVPGTCPHCGRGP